jgi:hypothetical protein
LPKNIFLVKVTVTWTDMPSQSLECGHNDVSEYCGHINISLDVVFP